MKIYGIATRNTSSGSFEYQKNVLFAGVEKMEFILEITFSRRDSATGLPVELIRSLKLMDKGDEVVFIKPEKAGSSTEEVIKNLRHILLSGINFSFLEMPCFNPTLLLSSPVINLKKQDEEGIIKVFDYIITPQLSLYLEKFFISKNRKIRKMNMVKKIKSKRSSIKNEREYLTKTERFRKTSAKIKELNRTFGGSLDNEETIKKLKISRATFYRYIKLIKEEITKGEGLE